MFRKSNLLMVSAMLFMASFGISCSHQATSEMQDAIDLVEKYDTEGRELSADDWNRALELTEKNMVVYKRKVDSLVAAPDDSAKLKEAARILQADENFEVAQALAFMVCNTKDSTTPIYTGNDTVRVNKIVTEVLDIMHKFQGIAETFHVDLIGPNAYTYRE